MSSVAVGQLRSIAKTVRQLPTFYQVRGSIADHYFLIVDKGAASIREAESLGAFQGDSIYGRIGEKLAHPSCHLDEMIPIAARTVPGWKLTVWYAVIDTLAPELIGRRSRSIVRDANGKQSMRFDTSPEEAEIVARAIEAEADRLEAQIKAAKGSAEQSEDAADESQPPATEPANAAGEGGESANNTAAAKKPKRSTVRGEGRDKLIGALTKHHKYADGSCLNQEPIGGNELARLSGVRSSSTASDFFKKEFKGHDKYRVTCRDVTALVAALKLLNQEYSPHHLFGAKPPREDEKDKDDE